MDIHALHNLKYFRLGMSGKNCILKAYCDITQGDSRVGGGGGGGMMFKALKIIFG